jgi:outer membrane protein insertion porin family
MLKFYITLFLLFFLNLSAEIIQKIEVKGNDRISDETIKVYGEVTTGKDYSAFDLNKILKNLYNTNFFEDVKISLSNNVLDITVKEYATINSIELQGEKSKTIKKKVLEKLNLQVKESFIENKISQDINLMKKIYASMGFNFAGIEAKIKKFDNNRINLVYILDKGKKTNISKINFIGDKKVKEKRLRDIIVSEEKKFWKFLTKNTFLNNSNIELDKRLLINYYKSIGYYDVQVLSSNAEVSQENFTNLTYTINAGTRYRVNKISTNVSDVLDEKLFASLQGNYTKVVGKYYSPFTVKKLLDDLDIVIANNDLQFIEHSVNEILEGESIEIKINIFEGKKQLVERIDIIGNTVTDESVIRSELLLDEGDPFNKLKLDQSIARLNARNIFGEIKDKINDGINKDQKIIEIEVEEKPTGEISAGAGIGTTGGSFAFNIKENNWLGKGVGISTDLELSAQTFSGSLSVSDPNYKNSGNSLNYFVSNTSNKKPDSGFKNNILSTGIGTKFEQYKNIYISPSLTLSYDDLKVESSASEALRKQKGTFTDLSFDYSISLDNRDKVYAPTDGYISSFSQGIPLYSDNPYLRNSYAFSKYKAITPDAIGTFKYYVSTINGLNDKDVRLSKRVNIPGSRLRGFKAGKVGPKDGVDFVGGNYAMASNFEISLPNLLPETTKTDVGLFLDFGNLWHVDYDKNIDDSNKIRSSAGINASWVSPVGPMTFIFSQNLSKAATDVTESFNFRLGTTF